jgi:hypothetical protein
MKKAFFISKWPTAIILSGLILFNSCKKDNSANSANDPDPVATVDAAQSDASVDGQFNDVFNITMGVQASDVGEDIGIGTGSGVIYRPANADGTATLDSVSRCFTVTVTPKNLHVFPKVVTIDFGSGCLGKDGKLRKGKIITTYTGPMFIPGNSATTTFADYNVDSFKIEGRHSVENTSTSNKLAWNVRVADGKITNTINGNWRKWSGVRELKQIEGNGTPLLLSDDIFQITGNGSGSNSYGNAWSSLITEPLVRKYICPWIGKGKAKITRNTVSAVLDYGDGTCDNKATITLNGIVHNISLR